uniref:anoctamin-10 isoform X1 n=2 Tax=Myxine glutinosa TaxID=7769 RepID=UPI00358F1D35
MEEVEKSSQMISFAAMPAQSERFRPLVVIELSPDILFDTRDWLLSLLCTPKTNGGAGLLVRPLAEKGPESTILLVGAVHERLLLSAEEFGLLKPDAENEMRPFTFRARHSFLDYSDDNDDFFMPSEQLYIIKRELDNLRAVEKGSVNGYPKIALYPGKSIFRRLQSKRLVRQLYPLHDQDSLRKLAASWYGNINFKFAPVDDIRRYFGDTVALYFSFLGYLTSALIPVGAFGLLFALVGGQTDRHAALALLLLIWVCVFIQLWKRHSAVLAYSWGSLLLRYDFEEPRPGFHGPLAPNLVTGRVEPTFPAWKCALRVYLVSVPFVIASLGLAAIVMFAYFWLEKWALDFRLAEPFAPLAFLSLYLPSAIYVVVIEALNRVYRVLAEVLTEWENHRLESSFQNHLVLKVLVFYFTNCFSSLFYIAFYLHDIPLLKQSLVTLLIMSQILNQIVESLLPFWLRKRRNRRLRHVGNALGDTTPRRVNGRPDTQDSDAMQSLRQQICIEGKMDVYLGTFDDYLELFLQLGYVGLFSCAFPLAAALAMLNNITELQSDALKFCRVLQRPFPIPTDSIGVWQLAFEAIGLMSIMTNCALVAMSPDAHELFGQTDVSINYVMAFVSLEHILLVLWFMLHFVLPDRPYRVRIGLAHLEFQSRLALKQQHEKMESLLPKDIIEKITRKKQEAF